MGGDVLLLVRNTARGAAAVVLFLAAVTVGAQDGSAPEAADPSPHPHTVRMAANPRYAAGGLHRVLLGPNYRVLWATPIEVQVLDLHHFAGGLTPVKKGGGKQTKSLRFEAADGREFRVRSVDKDPEAALPPEYRDTFVQWVAQDQISAANPAGPMIADRLEAALGLLHVEHRFVVIPDDPALGAFRKDFGGMLGILEERPRAKDPVTPGFEDVLKLYDWDEVWTGLLDESPDLRVDARQYLKARLLDMLIGDWDRHQRQWSWARVKGKDGLQAVPEDRDQAFAKFDGALLAVARMGESRFVNFTPSYPPLMGLNWANRFMDRRLLAELDRAAWEEVAREVQDTLSDSVLQAAVRQMPAEYYESVGPFLLETLKARRRALSDYALRYYALLAREAEVWGTERPELADILRNPDGSIDVSVSERGEDGQEHPPYFHRRFLPGETREIRIYLQGGDDRAVSHPRVSSPIEVRVIGSGGDDVLDDSQGEGTHFYDAEGHNRVVKGPGTTDSDKPFVPEVDDLGDQLFDWTTSTGPALELDAVADLGAVIGVKLQRTAYGFRKYPYRYQQYVGVTYSTGLDAWAGEYKGDFLRTNSRKRTEVLLRASAMELVRFFGYGNESLAVHPDEFYRAPQRQYLFQPRFRFGIEHVDWWVGPTVKFSRTELQPDHYLTIARPYGVQDFGQVGLGTSLLWDTRNRTRATTRGSMVYADANYYPGTWTVHSGFGEVHGEAATFLTAPVALQPTLALRVGGRRVWGTYPVQEAAFVGGPDTVRGLSIQRYAGDACAWGNAELRLRLARLRLLVPEDFGVFGLVDSGRVFLQGEDSRRWHTGVGGGIWISFLRRENTLSVALAHSEGETRAYFGAGFGF
jgi:hypothetical protein